MSVECADLLSCVVEESTDGSSDSLWSDVGWT